MTCLVDAHTLITNYFVSTAVVSKPKHFRYMYPHDIRKRGSADDRSPECQGRYNDRENWEIQAGRTDLRGVHSAVEGFLMRIIINHPGSGSD